MVSGALSLRARPDPLSRNERIAAWIAALAAALSRWPAVSKTLWDWDEALFALAVSDYDVTAHHPHPPGFPLFIALAKVLARVFALDGFHSVQVVTVIASLFVFPAMFFLARELRVRPFVALASGLLLAVFPNVWFFGGTAFSDVPSMVLVLAACALLLRGCRSNASLLGGALLLGIAAGFRPQNLIIGFAPLVIAFLHRRWTALAGALIIGVVVVASYAGAVHFSGGWAPYRETLENHERYIRRIDSFLSPIRPSLIQVGDDFFVRPYRMALINILVTILVVLGLREKRTWIGVAMFAPFLLFAWLYLDIHSVSRFAIGYIPMYALLAAAGIPRRMQVLTLSLLLALIVAWMWPILRVVHTTDSPPVAALKSLPPSAVVYVDRALGPHAAVLIPRQPRADDPAAATLIVREGGSMARGAKTFTRERNRLEWVARARYFEVTVKPNLETAP